MQKKGKRKGLKGDFTFTMVSTRLLDPHKNGSQTIGPVFKRACPMLIGLTGKAGAGKTTVARYLCKNAKFASLSFNDLPKAVIKKVFKLNRKRLTKFERSYLRDRETIETSIKKLNTYLKALQFPLLSSSEKETLISILKGSNRQLYKRLFNFVKDELFISRDSKIWIKMTMWKVLELQLQKKDIVIDDVQSRDEALMIKSLGGVMIEIIESSGKKANSKNVTKKDSIDADFRLPIFKKPLGGLFFNVDVLLPMIQYELSLHDL